MIEWNCTPRAPPMVIGLVCVWDEIKRGAYHWFDQYYPFSSLNGDGNWVRWIGVARMRVICSVFWNAWYGWHVFIIVPPLSHFLCNEFSNNLQSTPTWTADGVRRGGLICFILSIFGSILRAIVRVHMNAPCWVSIFRVYCTITDGMNGMDWCPTVLVD